MPATVPISTATQPSTPSVDPAEIIKRECTPSDISDEDLLADDEACGKRELDSDFDNGPAPKRKRTTIPKTKPKPKAKDSKPSPGGKGKKWTGAGLEALLLAVTGKSIPQTKFDDAVPGRTAKQCKLTWT